eukprot:TRINITY_DN3153_c0_g2_i1.p1 TRINITY_DN3153_c0_g2~~TRINITY_DN3153_c0_g2_i1.p1  ORF type:complete len:298 (-),score=25.34 TRINITY_DN3153_c0_g2_i1:287-1132(-)
MSLQCQGVTFGKWPLEMWPPQISRRAAISTSTCRQVIEICTSMQFAELPDDIIELICSHCEPLEAGHLAICSRALSKLSEHPDIWLTIAARRGWALDMDLPAREAFKIYSDLAWDENSEQVTNLPDHLGLYTLSDRGLTLTKTEEDGYIQVYVAKPLLTHGVHTFHFRCAIKDPSDIDIGFVSQEYEFNHDWLRSANAVHVSNPQLKDGCVVTMRIDMVQKLVSIIVSGEVRGVTRGWPRNFTCAGYVAAAIRNVGNSITIVNAREAEKCGNLAHLNALNQ